MQPMETHGPVCWVGSPKDDEGIKRDVNKTGIGVEG